MGFMQRQIEHAQYFVVNTSQGTEFVPADVVGSATELPVSELLDYLGGTPDDEDEVVHVKTGWLARLSAPGYLDCTDWAAYDTHAEAEAALEEMFGEDE